MTDDIVFRISGPAIQDDALKRQFSHDGYTCVRVFKVYNQRTTDILAPVHATPGTDLVAIKLLGGPMLVL
ncbi:MAG TPA: hypothetical protein VF774_12995, partial [Pseudoduganella sp.]